MGENCNCCNCNCETQICKYKCELNAYNLYDENGVYIKKLYDNTNDNTNDDPELDNVSDVEYCQMCNTINEYPNNYDNRQKKFFNNTNEMLYYSNFLKNNIIHNFNSIECEHCTSILNKGKFTIENVAENEENFNNLSFPNDFIRNIKLFNLEGSFVKEFEPNDYQEYRGLSDEYNTDISKNVLYCESCNFLILNSLRKIYKQ